MWLPIIMLGWGIVITLTGIVQNFTGLFIVRIFLVSHYHKCLFLEHLRYGYLLVGHY